VSKNGDRIILKAMSNYLINDTIFLRVSCRGRIFYDIREPMKDGRLELSFNSHKLPDGIIAFTLINNKLQPVAERLWFNTLPENRINIKATTDKDSYLQRDPTRLRLETTNSDGEPIDASLSVLVINKAQMGRMQSARANVLSHLLLSSDLKGDIENPGYYFSDGKDHSGDLDALLLTQGWRKYLYTKPLTNFPYPAEAKLIVSGSVSGQFFQNRKKVADLTLLTFGKTRSVQSQKTDSLGKFSFTLNDEYGRNLNILIQSANFSGQKKNYTITLDEKVPPPVQYDPVKTIEKVDSTVYRLVEKNIRRKIIENAFQVSSGNILLDEVEIQGYKMTPERKKVLEEYGKPERVIDGKAIVDKEAKWSYGLYSVLMFNFPDKVIVKRNSRGDLYARVRNSEITLVVIDGIPVKAYDYPMIPNIPPSEVSSFELIENARNFSRLYLETFPFANPADAPVLGDVIAIYTFAGKGIYGANPPVGIARAAIPVFAAPMEFYAPKYENLQPGDWTKPDLRALIHWQPLIRTDSLGKASSTFYNGDITGDMRVIIEAISEKGEIGYREMDYEVKK
jgi:hypothetical protein